MREQLLGHRYRTIENIGSGGMADVYRAMDETLGRTVAVKVMHARYAADPEFAARFRQEAQAAANLSSPNIVNMYDWGHEGETYYIAMEFVHGTDLKQLERSGTLASVRAAEIGAQVCAALSVAHGYDVIHRDIKPHNIMVQPDGGVKVMDFGIARAGNSTLTQAGSVLGTAQYLSPEQAQGKPLTAASDLYSLGVVLYEAATGQLPFESDTPVAVALMHVNEQAVPPHQVNPGIDPGLETVIVKAMQKRVADRYASADDMRRDLAAVACGGLRASEAETVVIPLVARTAVMPAVAGAAAGAAVAATAARAATSETAEVAHATGSGGGQLPRGAWVLAAALLVAAGLGVASSRGLLGGGGGAGGAPASATGSATAPATATSAKAPASAQQTAPAVVVAPDTTRLPVLIGMSEAEALRALVEAGLGAQALEPVYSNDVTEGQVATQTPAGDASAGVDSIVSYAMSLGPDPGAWGTGHGDRPGKSKNHRNE